jgi:hypothetical protein
MTDVRTEVMPRGGEFLYQSSPLSIFSTRGGELDDL